MFIDLKYYFDTIKMVNKQRLNFEGVYRVRCDQAPDARTKALLLKYQQKHARPPLRNSLG